MGELKRKAQSPMEIIYSILAGGAAGMAVDVILFPLDTVKTRLQSKEGFRKTGGFSGMYRGISMAFIGSAPNAAMFFVSYDCVKSALQTTRFGDSAITHMISATVGEVVACTVRVPIEVIKQRRQATTKTTEEILIKISLKEPVVGLYRGYLSTLLREIPFSIIQFPIWEYLKSVVKRRKGDNQAVTPTESGLCGAVAGGFSAAITTPLDLAKTRIMLAEKNTREAKGNVVEVLRNIYKQKGVNGLFIGVVPRTLWISIGGCIFFGTYELVKDYFTT